MSKYLVAPIVAWLVAQALKTIINTATEKKTRTSSLYESGGMPSGHAATVVALATTVLFGYGGDSVQFAIVAVFSSIVIYDAMMVRRSTGELGDAIVGLINKAGHARQPHVSRGHTPLQVTAGAVIGLIIGSIFSLM